MASKKRKKKKSERRHRSSTPLEAATEWAFELDSSGDFGNLKKLLAASPANVILVFPQRIRSRFDRGDERTVREAFTDRPGRNAIVASRKVLKFIANPWGKKGSPPPPWIA